MKVLQINTTFHNGGSTGRIVYELMQMQKHNGIEAFVAYGYDTGAEYTENIMCLQSLLQRKFNILRTRLFDNHGFYNEAESHKLIRWMDEIKPDIIHLHNIHNHYVNVKMLFDYIKQHEIPVVWTLHDCWSFTGHCAYFDYAQCDKWKSECHDCPLIKSYPPTWFLDRSTRNYHEKEKVFSGVKNLILISPSQWLANLTRESFLKRYNVEVINNGVDTDIFKPVASDIKERLGISDKKMVLAVMNVFEKRKGSDFLLELPQKMDNDEILVVVGLSPAQVNLFKQPHALGIQRTNNVHQLAELYSAADIFINPTLEDNFPTTNIEALACGTPVITFGTGGSVESVSEKTGIVVPKENLDRLLIAIRKVLDNGKNYYSAECVRKAHTFYDKNKQFEKYIELYKKIFYE